MIIMSLRTNLVQTVKFANSLRSRTNIVSRGVLASSQRVPVTVPTGDAASDMSKAERVALRQTIDKLFGSPTVSGGWVGGFPAALRQLFPTLGDHATLLNLIAEDGSDVIDVCIDEGKLVTVHFRDGNPPIGMNSVIVKSDHINALIETLRRDEDVLAATGRMGIPGTLHRVSVLHDFEGKVVGLTWRIGRDVDLHESLSDELKTFLALGKSVLFFGHPGAGKTTILRAAAAYVADCVPRRTVAVDATGEIGGYAAQPIGIGANTRRMCVSPGKSHGDAMLEVIRNHSPQTMIVDEIMTRGEAGLVQTCRARGIQLLATVHAGGLADVVENPIFADLMGGSQSAAISDAVAMRKGGAKFVRSRKHPAVFDGAYDVKNKTLFTNVDNFVDKYYDQKV
jgi:stage III sporulation protein SpoIIIAA